MAVIRPFRAVRYNDKLLDSMDHLIAPPYDVLNPEEQLALYQLSPYNIIRLEYGKTYPDDSADHNRYSRAAQTLSSWLAEGVLQPEEQKTLYLYEQSFQYGAVQCCRRGIIAALKVEKYSSGKVLPHELTFSTPKVDRLELLRKTRTNISPIFTLFPDPDAYISKLLGQISKKKPLFTLEDQSGQRHRITRIDNPDLQNAIIQFMKPQSLLIADGHHRYETALDYKEFENNATGSAADYILTILVSMKEPGLLMLPTHRMISMLNNKSSEKLVSLCKNNFSLMLMGGKLDSENDFQLEWEKTTRAKNAFAIVAPDFNALLIPNVDIEKERLGVELLHELIIDPFLSLPEVKDEIKNSLTFPHDFETIRKSVLNNNRDSIAFILDPIPVDEVYSRALQGKIMPQKTTYFYPKLPSGLLLRNLDLD
ncbi:MAG: DUF1015 domain-containing protein [Firmicutes bacterium]|nr:DUF1015 domain-containing protein [Bacillota bacterium]